MESKDYNKEHMARVLGRSLPVSTKDSIEICSTIRKKKVAKAKEILENAARLKKAVPIRRFKGNIPHKKGIGPGRYMKKAATEILNLLEASEANAQFKGLNTSDLVIRKAVANRASTQWHYGRQRRRKMKRTNVEIIVEEAKKPQKQGPTKKQEGKSDDKKAKDSKADKK
jgi:large subunit ribosomal protein L22